MTDREKLIELLNDMQTEGNKSSYVEWAGCKMKHEVKNEQIADHLIAHGVTFATDTNVGDKMTPTDKDTNVPSKWISVKDGLPEEADRYLCNIKSFAFPGLFYQAILKYDKHGFREGHIYTDDVTHWMPLPEPPKEE